MNRWIPCKRKDFIKKLKKLGFEGPYSGTRHEFLIHHSHRLAIPSNKEYSVPQLKMMLFEVNQILEKEISQEEWGRL